MFTAKMARRVRLRLYYYHLKKCAGTTMNSWLDTLSPAARLYNPAWQVGGGDSWFLHGDQLYPDTDIGRAIFYWSDVVHGHAPLRAYAPAESFCFTMLRDPVQRLISQFTDWRRLLPEDVAQLEGGIRACVLATKTMPLSEYLACHGARFARPLYDNHLTRALAATRWGSSAMRTPEAGPLLGEALQALHADYHFVGITEQFDSGRNALCALLGLPPCGPAEPLNRSRAPHESGPALWLSPADEARFTQYDRIVYDAACRLFAQRHGALGESYDAAAFEREHAAGLLGQLRATQADGAARYSVSDPFYGTGLHQRDGGFSGPHAVWTVSGRRASLYMPVPPGMPVRLLLWIRGYAGAAQRAMLRVWADGREVAPSFEQVEDYAEVLAIPHLAAAGFARLELELPHCPAEDADDTRPRGLSFDAYGWRPIEREPPAPP